jgi:hypothetical protein
MTKRIFVQHKDKDWFRGEVIDTVVYITGSYSDVKFVVALPDGSFHYDSIFCFKRIKSLKEEKE